MYCTHRTSYCSRSACTNPDPISPVDVGGRGGHCFDVDELFFTSERERKVERKLADWARVTVKTVPSPKRPQDDMATDKMWRPLCLPVTRPPLMTAYIMRKKVAHTRLARWSRFLAVSLQMMWVINPAVGCHYFPPGLHVPSQPLIGLLPILLLGEQRHDGCEQFA